MHQASSLGRWTASAATLIGIVALAGCVHPATTLGSNPPAADEPRWAGVFVTVADYEAGRPAAMIPCQAADSPINRESFAYSATINVSDPRFGAPVMTYPKDSVFGFRACDGTDVRFVGGENYHIASASPMYLYEVERSVPSDVGRHEQRFREYFFSVTAGDPVLPLTLVALKAAYPGNQTFHSELDRAFHNDDELARYDGTAHEYTVALILRECLQ